MDKLLIEYLPGQRGLGVVAYPDDAGIDLPILGEHILGPGERKDIPSGVRVAIPPGYFGRIIGRSSAIRKRGILVFEGIIDSGFRGELFSFVQNVGTVATKLDDSTRVAQIIVQPVVTADYRPVDTLPPSARGENGFGSSDRQAPTAGGSGHPFPLGPIAPLVYLGGPIDKDPDPIKWRQVMTNDLNDQGFVVFNPHQEAQGMMDVHAIFNQNMEAIARADWCLFNLLGEEGRYGFGSPIEIDYAMYRRKRVIIVHDPDTAGVYIRHYWLKGALVVPDLVTALREIDGAKVR